MYIQVAKNHLRMLKCVPPAYNMHIIFQEQAVCIRGTEMEENAHSNNRRKRLKMGF